MQNHDATGSLSDEKLFASVFAAAPVGMGLCTLDGVLVRVNRRFSEICGRSTAALLGQSFDNLIHPVDRTARQQDVRMFLQMDVDVLQIDGRCLTDRGDVVLLQMNGSTLRDETGAAKSLIITIDRLPAANELLSKQRMAFSPVKDRLCEADETPLPTGDFNWRTVIDHATDAIFLHGDGGVVLDANAQACESLGYTRHELIGMNPFEFDPQIDRDSFQKLTERLQAGESIAFDSRHRRKDGTEFAVEVSVRQFERSGSHYAIAIAHDISRRLRFEQALWESENRLAEAQSIARIGSWKWEPATGKVWWSDVVFALFGVDPQVVRPSFEAFLERVHPDDRPVAVTRAEAVLAGAEGFAHDLRIIRPDGGVLWLHSRARVTRDEAGHIICVEGTDQDITDRKRTELALEEGQRIAAAAESLAELGAWSWQIDANQWTFSEGWSRIHGCATREMGTRELMMLTHPEDVPAIENAFKSLMGNERYELEYRIVRPQTGEVRWVVACGELHRDARGRRIAYGVVRDITEQKRINEALRLARFTIDHAAIQVFWIRADATFVDVNEAALTALGYRRSELLGLRVFDIDLDHSALSWQEHWRELSRRGSITFPSRQRRKDGSVIEVEITAHLLDFDGEKLNCAFVRDVTERNRAEARLRESESRLRAILEGMPVMLDAFDEHGVLIAWNRECERVTGYRAEELIGNPKAMELLYPDSNYRERMISQWSQRGDDYLRWEWDIVRKDGDTRTIAWSNISAKLPVAGWSSWGIGIDVTETKKHAASLRESEELFRNFFEASGALRGIVELSEDDIVHIRDNAEAAAFFGCSSEFLRQKTSRQLGVPEKTIALWTARYRESERTGKPVQFEYLHPAPNGPIWFLATVTALQVGADGRQRFAYVVNNITEKKLTDLALLESEERLSAILNALPAHIALLNGDGCIVAVNETWRRFAIANALVDPGLGVGCNYLEVTERATGECSEEGPSVAAGIRKVLSGQLSEFRIEYPCHSPTEQRWFQLIANPVGQGSRTGAVVMHVNVTDRKRAEAELRQANELLRAVAEGTTDAVFVKDRDGKYLLFNQAAAQFVGKTVADVLGRDDSSLFDESSACRVMARDRRVMAGGVAETSEEILTAVGVTRVYLSTKAPYFDAAGKVAGVIGISRDVTELRRQEEKVRESQERLAALVDAAMDAIVSVDEDLRVILFNPAAETLFGCSAGEIMGESLDKLLPPSVRPEHRDRIHEFSKTGKTRRRMGRLGILTGLRTDGSTFPAEASITQAVVGGKRISTAIIRDVTERVEAEEALRQSLHDKDSLLKEVHHRVKNNLQIITSLFNLQAARIKDPSVQAVFAESQNRVRTMALVHETLYRSGRFGAVNLAEYLESLCAQMYRSYGASPAQIELIVEIAACEIDLQRAIPCGLIVNELVSNALKHAFPGNRAGTIRISLVRTSNSMYCLTVADDGIGMPFEPSHPDSTLGLQLVTDLAHQLGGRLICERGSGTIFRIKFPVEPLHPN